MVNSLFFGLSSRSGFREYIIYFLMFPTGIAISHFYRNLIIKLKILNYKIPAQLVFIIVFSFLKGVLFFLTVLIFTKIFNLPIAALTLVEISEYVINFSVIFCLWNVIYFGFQYFQNYRRSEINSLRYLAASKESELNNLKAQLNPHFIFNSMNSIRALIDENPAKAKEAVTRLSNILRNTLVIDKNKEINLYEEIKLVYDYLDLEKIRYEDRLTYEFKISNEVQNFKIPPFIIQTQVENAIKHGISKLPGKGLITIEAFLDNRQLNIIISNTGKLNAQKNLPGVGFVNSTQRLKLLYGEAATILIEEKEGKVVVTIGIPIK